MKRLARMIPLGLLVAACAMLSAQSALGDAVLVSVNANYLDTEFSATGGTYGKGVLTVADDANIVVEYDNGGTYQVTHDNGTFSLITSLLNDVSSGNMASGLFRDGAIVIQDSLGGNLLTGNIAELQLDEVVNNSGLLAGLGLFQVTGGSLATDFGAWGDIVQIAFMVKPASLADFSADFNGLSNITLVPREGEIPEPATMLLLGSGALLLVVRRRKR